MGSKTLKITLPNHIDVIKFFGTDEEIETFNVQQGYIECDLICQCKKNEYNWQINPQLFLIDYNIVDRKAIDF